MSEAVEKYAEEYARDYFEEYAKEYAMNEKVVFIKNLMKNMNLTQDQALDVLEIQGEERKQVIEQLQES